MRRAAACVLLAGTIVVCIIAALMFTSPYLTVTQVVEHADELIGSPIRVIGNVSDPALSVDYEEGIFVFELTDGTSSISVELEIGRKPPIWGRGMRVVAIGTLVSHDLIVADRIITGCRVPYDPLVLPAEAFPDERQDRQQQQGAAYPEYVDVVYHANPNSNVS